MQGRRRLIFATVVALLAIGYLTWVYYPASEAEMKDSDTWVVTETRYVVMDEHNNMLFAFRESRGDTLLMGILDERAPLERDTIPAQYIKKWDPLPYSGGAFVTLPYDTQKVVRMSTAEIKALLRRQAGYLEWVKDVMAQQRKDIDYYLKTHLVTEYGFALVERYSRALKQATDSVLYADSLVRRALKSRELCVVLERDYSLAYPKTARRYARVGEEQAKSRVKERETKRIENVNKSWVDSLGNYVGERDSVFLPHGNGYFFNYNGDFYAGEWEHGKRTGVGFRIGPYKRLRMGEWRDDKFLGERMLHTPERIYGIDISRYQHEQGRKRFPIDWKNLRITSLGKATKKEIRGVVDYPVRFVYIKATEGVTIANKYFAQDYADSRKSGHRTGAYHFMSLKTTGSEQAQHFLKNARYHKGDLPPVLDVEPSDRLISQTGGEEKMFQNVRAWLHAVEKAWGVRPILYVSQRFVKKYLPDDLKRDYDVWIARYSEYRPDVTLVYWQLCQDGRVQGIQGPVDINVFNGFDF